MSSARRNTLLELARAMPEGSAVTVPAAWIIEVLEGVGLAASPTDQESAAVDLTVDDLAQRFGKAPSTIRAWCERGDFPGAYRRGGKEWRIPPAALESYQSVQRERWRVKGAVEDAVPWPI